MGSTPETDSVKQRFGNIAIIERIATVLSIPESAVPESADGWAKGFCCVLPGHEEKSASAKLYLNDDGVFVYVCFHPRDEYMVRTLPEVYLAQRTGEARQLRGFEGRVWALRLLAEAGVIEPIHVDLPELPRSTESAVRKVYEGIRLLFSLRWMDAPGTPVAFSWRFAAAWCGVHESSAGEAIRELLRLKIIHIAEHHPGPFGKRMALFLPGPGPPKRAAPDATHRDDDEGSRADAHD